MGKLLFILISAGIILFGCNPVRELKKDEALKIINKELNYPRVYDYDIFCSDPEHAKSLLDTGLESNGMVTVQKTQKLKDIGKPLVQFTEKARLYLLPTPDKDKALDVQKVKIADEEVIDLSITQDDESKNTVWVEYTSVYKNITPFSVLMKRNLNEPVRHRVKFSLSANGWILQKPVL
ncbi:MAG: hypothetical protein M0Q53_10285 [Prolixibacteraceae bacterium]|jgi:hypothetical protein|nr:hypothetical protein [Prolixibacteraceae bacterium]